MLWKASPARKLRRRWGWLPPGSACGEVASRGRGCADCETARAQANPLHTTPDSRSASSKNSKNRLRQRGGCWDGALVAEALGVGRHKVWRILRAEGICLARQRSWCVSTDPQFALKATDIIGLYLNAPLNALVLSVDEKPSIQALTRPCGYVKTSDGKVVHGIKSTYKRNGTVNLFAALDVASGHVHAKTTETKKREDFRQFMDEVLAEVPAHMAIHVILDNYSTHKKNADWLERYEGRVSFHFTPTSASWLNLVEVFFGLLTRQALRGGQLPDPRKPARENPRLRRQAQPATQTFSLAQA